MAKELERAGFPTAVITSLAAVAVKVGANRIVRGNRFSHPCGHPGLPSDEERAWRVGLVRTALAALATAVEGPTVFEPAG
jgi:glycine/betaine/sarcosine/D-proline reductase family selenoprotein B